MPYSEMLVMRPGEEPCSLKLVAHLKLKPLITVWVEMQMLTPKNGHS